eukprot:g19552.t1
MDYPPDSWSWFGTEAGKLIIIAFFIEENPNVANYLSDPPCQHCTAHGMKHILTGQVLCKDCWFRFAGENPKPAGLLHHPRRLVEYDQGGTQTDVEKKGKAEAAAIEKARTRNSVSENKTKYDEQLRAEEASKKTSAQRIFYSSACEND